MTLLFAVLPPLLQRASTFLVQSPRYSANDWLQHLVCYVKRRIDDM
jgi:hypothetical protein